ncbi:MAG: methylated-DNA--[protein]-cysteine S-methyltransferase [Armatimonadota bacterium]
MLVAWSPQSALPAGWMGLAGSESGITRIILPQPAFGDVVSHLPAASCCPHALLRRAYWQVRSYLCGHSVGVDFPVDLSNLSSFGRHVLQACRTIPRGQTASYRDLAVEVDSPSASRAVGQVMANNPVPIAVPCHRVIGSDGSLTGFGEGLEAKWRLLNFEGADAALKPVSCICEAGAIS